MNSVENACILILIKNECGSRTQKWEISRSSSPTPFVSSESASVWAVIGIRSCYSISRQQYHHATGHIPHHFVLVTSVVGGGDCVYGGGA